MHISWLGSTSIKIQAKPFDEDITIVIDPYKPNDGVFPRSLTPHIALYTRGEDGSVTLSGNPFILSTPGECETKGVLMTAISGKNGVSTLIRIDAEQLSLAHLGRTKEPLTEEQLEVLGDVDILCIPVGGGEDCYDAETAVKMVNAIEPRIVIPIAFRSDNDPKADPVETFLKEMGLPRGPEEKKVIIKKKDLPQEETKVVVLAKE